jgi:copper chaperone CopZ
MTEKTFNVPDMSCGHCKAAVEGGLKQLPGVERATPTSVGVPLKSPMRIVR